MKRRVLGAVFIGAVATLVSCGHESAVSRSPLPFGSVDLPAARSSVKGTITVAGWALAEQPVQEVSVYVDRKYLTSATLKVARPDVAAAKPDFKDAPNCGFSTAVDTSNLGAGWHEIVVQARSSDGASRDLATVPVLVQP